MPVALQGGQEDRQQRAQAFAAYPVGGFPEHDQCSPHCLVIQQGAYTGLPLLDGRLGVQRANRRLLVIAGHRDELIEDLALLSAGCNAVTSPDCVRQFGPRRKCHLGAHSPSEIVETPWWQARSPVTSQLRQLPQPVTVLLRQCGGSNFFPIPFATERRVQSDKFRLLKRADKADIGIKLRLVFLC
jgi:hypothetical protein